MSDGLDLNQFKEIFIAEVREHLSLLNTALSWLEKDSASQEAVNKIFRAVHTVKGMSATMGFDDMARLSHSMENVFEKMRERAFELTPEGCALLFECADTLDKLLDDVAGTPSDGANVAELVERLRILEVTDPAVSAPRPVPVAALVQPACATEASEELSVIRAPMIRIRAEHLDKLMNLVGELVITRSRLGQIAARERVPELSSVLAELTYNTAGLQEEVLRTRMVPVKNIFDRYPRVVRDLARHSGKEVSLLVEGTDIEIDRMLLEEANDAIVHLLRNAVDHGIEEPGARVAAGKSPAGTITLSARREKGYVRIDVSDDGAGIDAGKVRQKAVERGLLPPDDGELLSAADILLLICRPGFSTASAITDISGRGVGLDVVKHLVDSFNGRLSLSSTQGTGSTFTLQLPLTIAIIQALLANVGAESYAIPLTNISEIVPVDRETSKTIANSAVLSVRDTLFPLFRLSELFAVPGAAAPQQAVVVENGGCKVALAVDSLAGKREIVIKNLPGIVKGARYFGGATILGDGRVVLIVDVASLC